MKAVDGAQAPATQQRAYVEQTVALVPEPAHVETHGSIPEPQPKAPDQKQGEQQPDRPLGEVVLLQGIVEIVFSRQGLQSLLQNQMVSASRPPLPLPVAASGEHRRGSPRSSARPGIAPPG